MKNNIGERISEEDNSTIKPKPFSNLNMSPSKTHASGKDKEGVLHVIDASATFCLITKQAGNINITKALNLIHKKVN